MYTKVYNSNLEIMIARYYFSQYLLAQLEKKPPSVYYLPMHAVRKESSLTRKIRAVFNAFNKNIYQNIFKWYANGEAYSQSLVNVLIHFRQHKVALIILTSEEFTEQ